MTNDFKAAYAACIGSLAVFKNKFPSFVEESGEKFEITYKNGVCLCKGYAAAADTDDSGISLKTNFSLKEILPAEKKLITKLFAVAAGYAGGYDGISIYLMKDDVAE